MILERLSRGMQIKHVRESVDDAELVKEIEELKERIKNKTKELKVLRKNAVSKYCTELSNGEVLYNSYYNSYYVYDAINNDLIDYESNFD